MVMTARFSFQFGRFLAPAPSVYFVFVALLTELAFCHADARERRYVGLAGFVSVKPGSGTPASTCGVSTDVKLAVGHTPASRVKAGRNRDRGGFCARLGRDQGGSRVWPCDYQLRARPT